MNKTILVAKREFAQTVRRSSFWVMTIFFPFFLLFVAFFTQKNETQNNFDQKIQQAERLIQEKLKLTPRVSEDLAPLLTQKQSQKNQAFVSENKKKYEAILNHLNSRLEKSKKPQNKGFLDENHTRQAQDINPADFLNPDSSEHKALGSYDDPATQSPSNPQLQTPKEISPGSKSSSSDRSQKEAELLGLIKKRLQQKEQLQEAEDEGLALMSEGLDLPSINVDGIVSKILSKNSAQISLTSSPVIAESPMKIEEAFIPILLIIIYLLMIIFSANSLMSSSSEEKENRIIETIFSLVPSKSFIWGKLLGQTLIIVSQILILLLVVFGGIYLFHISLPINFDQIEVNPQIVMTGIFCLFCGFFIMANVILGIGAAMPTAKDGQLFSSVFLFLSTLPLYFVTAILANPSSATSIFASYFPFTAPMIFLFRISLADLSLLEIITNSSVILSYVAISFFFSFRLFEVGALEYTQKFNWKILLKDKI